jgi:hypothetical protein
VPAGTWEDDDDLRAEVSAIVGKDCRDRKASGPAIIKELRSMAGRWLGRPLTAKEHDRLQALTLGQQKIRRALGRDPASRTQPVKASAIVRELLSWRHNLTDPDVRKMQLPRKPKPVAHDFTALVLKYESYEPFLDADGKPATHGDGRLILVPAAQPRLDADGKPTRDKEGRIILIRRPICDDDGRPILWVPDEHGQPSRPYGVLDEHGQLRPYIAGEPLPRRRVKAVRPPVKMIFR